MSTLKYPVPARLIVSVLMKEKGLMTPVMARLTERFGPLERMSDWLPFDYTDYYTAEMGRSLVRRMLVFRDLIDQERLPDVKRFTNRIEADYTEDGRRRVNVDPGYLTPERLILATGKNFSHRVYLRDGIFADLTLIYTRGDFQSLPWTYADYAQERMKAFLRDVRADYLQELKRNALI